MKAYSQDLRERVLRAVDQGYQRGSHHQAVWRVQSHDQTLPQAKTGNRSRERQSDSWSPSQEIRALTSSPGGSVGGPS
jgi:hypothetical protein